VPEPLLDLAEFGAVVEHRALLRVAEVVGVDVDPGERPYRLTIGQSDCGESRQRSPVDGELVAEVDRQDDEGVRVDVILRRHGGGRLRSLVREEPRRIDITVGTY
jgi:hypothetical protein